MCVFCFQKRTLNAKLQDLASKLFIITYMSQVLKSEVHFEANFWIIGWNINKNTSTNIAKCWTSFALPIVLECLWKLVLVLHTEKTEVSDFLGAFVIIQICSTYSRGHFPVLETSAETSALHLTFVYARNGYNPMLYSPILLNILLDITLLFKMEKTIF